MDKHAFPILERLAKRQFSGDKWEGLSLKEKQVALKEVIKIARADIKTSLGSSYEGPERQASLIMKINNKKSNGADALKRVLEKYDVAMETLDDLSVDQLDLLLLEVEVEQERDKDKREDSVW